MKHSPFAIRRPTSRHATARPRPLLARAIFGFLYCFGLGIAFLFSLFLVLSPTIPNVDSLQHLVAAQSSIIYDRNGEVIYTVHGEEDRKEIPFSKISPNIVHATLAIEDDQFYHHIGIDFTGLLAAACGQVHLCPPRGGSTITQQFAKNAFLSSERTYIRKLKEIFLALKLERRFTKDQILDMYLNRINYSSTIYGVELAAETFFGKPAADLDILEAAILAAIPKAPSFFSPYGPNLYAQINLSEEEITRLHIQSEQDLVAYSPNFITKGLLGKTYTFGETSGGVARSIYVKGRVDFVLERMKILGMISDTEMRAALTEAETKTFLPFRDAPIATHFVLYVRQLLEQKYGKEILEKGGLKITTTLDLKLQKAAEDAVTHYAEDNEKRLGASDESLLAMDPDNGQIVAMVGSRDYANDAVAGKVNMVFRPRLPGSSFKPFVYAAAFLKGYAPASVLYDVSTKFGDTYQPDDFDGTYLGPLPIRKALAYSRNIPAVKAAYLAGLSNVITLVRNLGIPLPQPDDWYGLSLAIGAGEVQLVDMVRGYASFANGGYKVDPVSILKIEDKNGNILEEYEPPKDRPLVLDPQAAYLINDVLSDESARPEGFWHDVLTIPGQINAAKTGTSNKKKPDALPDAKDANVPFDGWTLGYTRNLVTGVWAGNANGQPMKIKGDGLNAAGRPWHDFMVAATAGKPREAFDRPEGIKFVQVSRRSGKLPSEFTPEEDLVTEVFASFDLPTEVDNSYQMVEIDKVSGKLATELTPEAAREKKGFFVHHSERPDNPQWEDPVRQWAKDNKQDEVPPTEYDDVHTATSQFSQPDIRIVSPAPAATVLLPHVGVVVEAHSSVGVSQVDYYWDDKLVESVKNAPYRAHLDIPVADNSTGSSHVIKAVVLDALYHSNQASVEVKVGSDALPPEVHLVYPASGASVPAGSVMTAQADAYDSNGDVKKVEWYWEGALKTTTGTAPYLWSFPAPTTPGAYPLKAVAYDYAGNMSPAEITVNVNAQDWSTFSGVTRLLQPAPNQSFDPGASVVLKAYLDDATRSTLKTLLVFAKPEKGNPVLIAQSSEQTTAPFYTFVWPTPAAGRYELFLKIVLQNGEIRFSERVPLVVR